MAENQTTDYDFFIRVCDVKNHASTHYLVQERQCTMELSRLTKKPKSGNSIEIEIQTNGIGREALAGRIVQEYWYR